MSRAAPSTGLEAPDPLLGMPEDAFVRRLAEGIVASPRADREPDFAPFTGKPLAELPLSTPADVDAAYVAARAAQRAWVARPVAERARLVGRVHDLVLDRQSQIADLVQAETGKARRDAFEEIGDVALAARYNAAVARRLLRTRRRLGLAPGLTQAWEVRHPWGVVGIVSPWNYPFTLSVSDTLPALVAGNAVVHKPDTQAALTALLGRSLAVEAGVPEGLWQIVVGDGPTIGGAVVDGADFVSFTGSTATGRTVARRTAERLVGACLELGGKNPLIVLADADLDRAAEGAVRACFSTSGQLCVSTERLYVAEAVRETFLDRFLERVRAVRVAAAFDYTADMGSLASQAQLDRVVRHVADAVGQGATLLAGGRPRPDLGPWFFEPTVLTDVRAGMLVADEESFGPVVSVYGFGSEDDAVRLANGTPYGLSASVWTRDTRRGVQLAQRLRYGAVNVNEAYGAVWGSHDLPLGGMGDSGLGRRHGREGLLRFTEAQGVAVQRLHGIRPPLGVSYELFARGFTRGTKVLRRLGRP